MKKIISFVIISSLVSGMCASFAYAAGYSYTCSNTSLSSIAVNDPNGADASTVSDYITKCTNAGGTVSGASAQQLNGVTGSPSAGSTASTGPCTSCNLGYTPLEPIPGVTSGVNLIDPHNLPAIINSIFTILITVGALLAVLFLTIGGVQYMLSESAGGKNEGIRRATAAMWGILLIAGIWLILHTINPNLLSFNLNPCPNGGSGCTINSNITNSTTSAQPVTTGTIDLTGDTATKDAIRSSAGIGTFSLWDGTYVTYSAGNQNSAQVTNFTNQCQSWNVAGISIYSVKQFSGNLVNQPGTTGLICSSN